MAKVKVQESWTIRFTDRVCATIYAEDTVGEIVRGTLRGFSNGTVSSVTFQVREWFGSWDDGTRGFDTIYSAPVVLDTFR